MAFFHSPKHCLDSTDDQNTPTKPFRSLIVLEKLYQTYLEIVILSFRHNDSESEFHGLCQDDA